MKTKIESTCRWAWLASVAFALMSSSLSAQLYWDSNGATAGTGATPTGTWGTSAFWTTDPLGGDGLSPVPGAWVQGETAVFSAGTEGVNAFTVTVGGATNNVSKIIVEEGTPTFNGGTLTLNGLATVEVGSGRTNIFGTTIIAGSAGLTKEGAGVLQINSAANSYTGGTTVKAGTLTVGTTTTVLGNTAGTVVFDGGNMRAGATRTFANPFEIKQDALFYGDAVSGVRAITFTGNFTGTGGTIRVRHTGADHVSPASLTGFSLRFRQGGININRPIVLGQVGDLGMANLRMDHNSGADQIVSGDISGPGVFERNNNGSGIPSDAGFRTILTGNNTYSGGTHLRGNYIGIGSDTALGTGPILIGQDPIWVGFFAHGTARTVTNDIAFDTGPSASRLSATNLILSGALPLTFSGNIALPVNTTNPWTRLTITNGMVATLSGSINPSEAAAVGIDKHGPDTLILSGNNTYTGNTRVSVGTLLVNNTSGSGTGSGNVTVNSGATLGGIGAISGTVTLDSGATISAGATAGASVESLATGSQTWAGGATNIVEINDATGTQGVDPGWDLIDITGGLDITATTGNKFTINIQSLTGSSSGPAANFNSGSPYSWTIVKTTTGITGFDAEKFTLDASGFQNALNGGFFTISTANGGNDLVLNFNVAPAAPVIVAEPTDVTVAAGGNAQFNVSVLGDEPLTYIWKRNNVDLVNGGVVSGANTATLTLTGVMQADAGNYSVTVTNIAGSTNSAVAVLTVIDPPVITTALTNQEVSAGANVSFVVAASGTAPFTYVWTKNSVPISGETTDTLNLTAVSSADAGTYQVSISNFAGTNNSSATLIVNQAPVITIDPVNQEVLNGDNAVFTVTATGYPLNYQWSFNGSEISGATDSSYTVSGANSADIGFYSVVVTNVLGSDSSASAKLSISQVLFSDDFDSDHTADWIVNKSVNPGGSEAEVFFDYNSVGISSAPNSTGGSQRGLRLRANMSGATFSGLSVSPTNQSFSGDYELRFDLWQNYPGPLNGGGTGSTQITGAGIGTAGTNAQWAGGVFDAIQFGASGDGGSGQDWRVYPKAALAAPASGIYAAGTSTSPDSRNEAHPYYTNKFGGQSAPAAQVALYPSQTNATFLGAPGFKWHEVSIKKQGTNVTWTVGGHLIATVNISSIALGGGNIFFNQYDVNGTMATETNLLFGLFDNVKVIGLVAPVITAQPQDATVAAGLNASFSVTASSSIPGLSYQWRKDGVNISGATDSSLQLNNVQLADDGSSYSVLVFNDSTVVTSDSATLTVVQVDPPTVNVSPATQNINQGASATFTANATGGSLSYQWYHGATLLSGATDSALTVNNVQPADIVDGWTVVVTNLAGSVTSTPAATVSLVLDSGIPKLTVTTPKPKAGTNAASVMLTGVAKDTGTGNSGIISSVKYVYNSGNVLTNTVTNAAAITDLGKGTWSFTSTAPLTLAPGTNIIHVVASDLAGNQSTLAPFIVYYDLTNTLTLNIVGQGSVKMGTVQWHSTTNIAGTFKVGRPYKIDAFVGKGTNYVFTNWATLPNEVGYSTNNWVQKASLSFVMQENMTINATFMTNPFTPVAGTYNGLFSETNGVTHETAGFIQVKVKDKSTYSGYVIFDGNKTTFAGKLKTDGTVSREVSRSKVLKGPVNLTLAVDLEGNEEVTGTLSATNGAWTAELLAYKAVYSEANPETNNFANYTMTLPVSVGAPAGSPGGVSFGTVTNNVKGEVKLGMLLAEGSKKATQKVPMSREGQWPLYLPLYKNAAKEYKGTMMGWVSFNGATNAPTGNVIWIKKDGSEATQYYGAGFSNDVTIAASPYVTPALGQLPVTVNVGDLIIVSDGNIAEPVTNVVTGVDLTKAKVTLATTNTVGALNKATIAFKGKDGTFVGGWFDTAINVGLKTKTQGAVLQNAGSVTGFFLGTSESGTARIEPATP